ncbi:MAG: repeat-containing protein YrrB [Planctomycetota bacterium]
MTDLNNPNHSCDQAYAAYQSGNRELAQHLISTILGNNPRQSRALYLQGVLYQESGRLDTAIQSIEKALEADPANGVYANALGELFQSQGQRQKAWQCFEKSVSLNPGYARSWNNMGLLKHQDNQFDQAIQCFQKAVSLNPSYAIAWNNLGAACQKQKDHKSAIQCFQKAIGIVQGYPEAFFNLGISLLEVSRPGEAAVAFQKAIEIRPAYEKAVFQLGLLLQKFRNDFQALEYFQKAVQLNPESDEYARVLGDHLLVKRDWEKALAYLEKALKLNPSNPSNLARLFHGRQLLCDWGNYQQMVDDLWKFCEQAMSQGKLTPVGPFQSLTMPWSCEQLQQISRNHSAAYAKKRSNFGTINQPGPRLRIGYVSGDLYDHAVGHLLHGFFEKHDRANFEVFVYSFSPSDGSIYRIRIEKGVEHFVDASSMDASQLSEKIAHDGIQILVDLMGYTGVHRVEVFASRPAPLQVSFLGMLGTMGANFIDYLVADPHIVSSQMENHFDEKLIRLPHSYLIAQRMEPAPKTTRADHHLPSGKFVFCSFNNAYKIEPFTFDCWMNILRQVPESVLWLSATGRMIEDNLRRNAQDRGVDSQRLVFAPFAKCDVHVERQSHADLFLDTFIYNAAATGSMALQAGLPILTMQGNTFSSRVGSSLLHAVGLGEMVTHTPEEYVARAVELACNSKKLATIRETLRSNLAGAPLFDSARFVQNLERAYQAVWQKHLQGKGPDEIVVEE